MARIIYFFRSEIMYFTDTVAPNARRLAASTMIMSVASPLMTIFLNAFVWRATGSLLDVAAFNILQFSGLPLGFLLNGMLLRRYRVERLFAFGALLMGAGSFALVVFGSAHPALIPLYGFFLWGVGRGFYWGNRNYLELQETTDAWRQYFFGLLYSVSSLSKILVPFAAGWFIVLVRHIGILPAQSSYWMLFGIALALMALCAAIIARGSFATSVPELISRLRIPPFWNKRRLLNIAIGLFNGTEFMAVLLVLYALGNEGILGTISSFTAMCVALGLYVYGRAVRLSGARRTILVSGLAFFACAALLAVLPGKFGAGVYFIGVVLSLHFAQVAADPELLSLSDKEMGARSEERYSFIFDNELFLNTGRVLGIGIILALVFLGSERIGFFYGPLAISAVHIFVLLLFLRKNS